MDNNHASLTGGQIEFSSELSAFPQSNAQDTFRSKVWKPSGYFLIVLDTNDKIYIDDGTQKTITLTAGEYTTPALMATEVQTQLNASSSGWTFDHNDAAGAYKFRFAHASGHTLEFSNSTEAAWNLLGFTLGVDEVMSTERDADEQRNHQYEFVTYDLGGNQAIEFFSVISPLDEEFSISDQANIKLMANNLDQWDAPPLEITLVRSDGGLFKFLDDVADSSYRFWRFQFEDKYSPSGPTGFSLAYIYIGDYATLDSRNIQRGFTKTIDDPSRTSTSESGALFFDRKTKFSRLQQSSIALIDQDQRDTLEQLFFDFGTTTPFFVSYDPRLSLSNNLFDLTKYVVFEKPPKFTHVNHNLFNMTLSFREVL